MSDDQEKNRKFRAVPSSLVTYDRKEDEAEAEKKEEEEDNKSQHEKEEDANRSFLEQIKQQEQEKQQKKKKERTVNNDRTFLEQVKQQELLRLNDRDSSSMPMPFENNNNNNSDRCFLEQIKQQQQQQKRQPQVKHDRSFLEQVKQQELLRINENDSSMPLSLENNDDDDVEMGRQQHTIIDKHSTPILGVKKREVVVGASSSSASTTRGADQSTRAVDASAPGNTSTSRRRPPPPGAFSITGIHARRPCEEEPSPPPDSTTSTTTAAEEDGILVTAQLVQEDHDDNNNNNDSNHHEQLQSEIERLRQQHEKIPVVAAIDEQAQERKWRRRLAAAVVVIFALVGALAAGLRVGLADSEPVDLQQQQQPPLNLSTVGLALFDQVVELEDYYTFLQNTYSDTNFTILAPTDVAFRDIPQNYFENFPTTYWRHARTILLHHTFRGSQYEFEDGETLTMLGGNTITVVHNKSMTTNDTTTEGFEPSRYRSGALVERGLLPQPGFVVHSVDGVFPVDFLEKDAVDLALENNLTLIVELIKASGLEDYARTTNDFTAFLPTNAALEKLPPGTVEELSSNAGLLIPVFLRHIYPGILYSEGFGNQDNKLEYPGLVYGQGFQNQSLLSVGNDQAVMTVSGDNDGTVTLTVDGLTARVVQTDMLANNALIHFIDTAFVLN